MEMVEGVEAQVTEVPIFPHVLEVGAKMVRDGMESNLTDQQIALTVYLAMDELLHVTYLASGQEVH